MNYLSRFVGTRTALPTVRWGTIYCESASFSPAADGDLVVEFGRLDPTKQLLLRIHSECVFGEVLSSSLCDCADQLEHALEFLSRANGMLIYLRFDGRGAGLAAKVKATSLEVEGLDTHSSRVAISVEPEGRDFKPIQNYLVKRGFKEIRIMTNNPIKVKHLECDELKVCMEPLLIRPSSIQGRKLLKTKAEQFGHVIPPQFYLEDDGDGT